MREKRKLKNLLNIVSHNTTWNKERERGKEKERKRET
jgi:hypothetical protein